jgi:hypothetical protein
VNTYKTGEVTDKNGETCVGNVGENAGSTYSSFFGVDDGKPNRLLWKWLIYL